MTLAVPVGAPLREALSRAPRSHDLILVNSLGEPWTESGFWSSWRKACELAGVTGRTFHDLRGTAVTRLVLAGSSVPEIASVTGHSLADVVAILDAHYLTRDPKLAESGIRKLKRHTRKARRIPDQTPDRPSQRRSKRPRKGKKQSKNND